MLVGEQLNPYHISLPDDRSNGTIRNDLAAHALTSVVFRRQIYSDRGRCFAFDRLKPGRKVSQVKRVITGQMSCCIRISGIHIEHDGLELFSPGHIGQLAAEDYLGPYHGNQRREHETVGPVGENRCRAGLDVIVTERLRSFIQLSLAHCRRNGFHVLRPFDIGVVGVLRGVIGQHLAGEEARGGGGGKRTRELCVQCGGTEDADAVSGGPQDSDRTAQTAIRINLGSCQ